MPRTEPPALDTCRRYIKEIQDREKAEYARAYLLFLLEGGNRPDGDKLGIKPWQAMRVRITLEELLNPSAQSASWLAEG